METNQNILDKIKKLLAKADSTDSPQEAENLFATAQMLMVKHRITQEQLKEQDPEVITQNQVSAFEQRLEGEWETSLARVIFHVNGCDFVRNKHGNKFDIYGASHDVLLVKYLYETTREAFRRLARSEWRKNQHYTETKKNQYIRSFLVGACAGLKEKIRKMTAEVEKETNTAGYGLIIANKVEKARAHIMKNPNIVLKRTAGGTAGSTDGYGDGVKAGRNHKLTRPLSGSGSGGHKLLG